MEKKKLLYILMTVCYMALLLFVSLSPLPNADTTGQIIHNLLHIPAYGVLAYLIIHWFFIFAFKAYMISFLFSSGFGVLNEFLQSFVPGRTASSIDVLLNIIGVALFLGFIMIFKGRGSAKKY